MRIVIGGSTGLVGEALVKRLTDDGHDVARLVRKEAQYGEIRWYPEQDMLQGNLLGQPDAVVHLGGENIAEGRWNAAKKRRIRDSRVVSTKLLSETLAQLDNKPSVFVCASAIGYYGDRGDEVLDESAAPGANFLADVCQEWEAATQPAKDAGIRVVNLRISVVLSRHGAALAKILTPFKLGAGGIVGSGKQYWSCVSRPELVNMIAYVIQDDSISGPTNAVSAAVTNREFTKTLGRILGRPTLLPLPAFAVNMLMGEMGQELLLASSRVEPKKLREAGYEFMDGDIEASLRSALNEA